MWKTGVQGFDSSPIFRPRTFWDGSTLNLLFFASNLLLVKKRKVYFLCYIGMPGSRVGLDQPILGDGHQCILIGIYVPTMFGCPWNGMDDHKPYTVALSYVT